MKNKILFKYIFQEILPVFFASLLVSLFIVITTRMFSLIEMVVSHGASFSHVMKILLYLTPEVLLFSFPAVTLISVLVAFLRLSSDNEIIAFKASGISLYQIIVPVIVLSFFACLVSFIIGVSMVPWGNRSLKRLIYQIVKEKADVGIKERVFCEPFKGIIFYVNHFSVNQSVMQGVFVVDKRDKTEVNTIIAKQAEIINWKNSNIITFHFVKGTMFSTDKNFNSIRTIGFSTYDLNIMLKEISPENGFNIKPKEMGIRQLLYEISRKDVSKIRHNLAVIEFMERLSIPIGVLLMGIIGVPLGMQIKVKNSAMGIGIGLGLGVFFVYYAFLAGVKSISETGLIPPAVGMCMPDVFLLFVTIYFIKISAEDREIYFFSFLSRFFKAIKKI